jgi:GrpB-like predicted nucleotidyltransferase (UPF0157 family)
MNAEDAVGHLEATGVSRTAALRTVGYAALMQHLGREKLASLMNDEDSFRLLIEGFKKAGVDPLQVRFPEGASEPLEEVVRTGYHAPAREAARRLLDAGSIADTSGGRPVRIQDYDPAWPGAYWREASIVRTALTGLAVAIEHIGSTSVPGLAAKPVIDILVGIRAFAQADAAIARLCDRGYLYVREAQLGLPAHASVKRGSPTTHRVHLVEHEGVLWNRYFAFREALRADAALAEEYEHLKRELAATYRADRAGYTAGKTAFILRVIGEQSSVDSSTA